MSYTLKFEHPQFPPDYEFGIANFGVVKNGSTVEIDEDQERQFIAEKGKTIEDAFKDSGVTEVTGSSTISAEEVKTLLPAPEVTENVVDNSSSAANSTSDTGATPAEVTPPVQEQQQQGGEM